MEADLIHFPGKTGLFFPFRNPLYFSAILPLRASPECRMTCRPSVFHAQRKAAKLHGFFLFKTLRFKKYLIKTIIVERIGTTSTGTFRTQIRPGNSPSEKRSWERVGPHRPSFIRRSCPKRWGRHTTGHAGWCNRSGPHHSISGTEVGRTRSLRPTRSFQVRPSRSPQQKEIKE